MCRSCRREFSPFPPLVSLFRASFFFLLWSESLCRVWWSQGTVARKFCGSGTVELTHF